MKTETDTLLREAERAYQGKRFTEAAEGFAQAAVAYRDAGDAIRAAELDNNRSVALLQSGDAAGALAGSQGSDAVFAQAGLTRQQALALGNQAAALEELGNAKEALERYRQCSSMLKSIGEQEQRALVLARISALEMRRGKALEAMTAMEVALENKKNLSLLERLLRKILNIPFQMLRRR